MTSGLNPYNFTISDQSPLLQYLPFRDGPIITSWNVTYSGDSDSAWVPDAFIGSGVSDSVLISSEQSTELFVISQVRTERHLQVPRFSWIGPGLLYTSMAKHPLEDIQSRLMGLRPIQ
jgi:hypothetical protein